MALRSARDVMTVGNVVLAERAVRAVALLDARVSASPIAGAWAVRACAAGAASIAAVDGHPVRETEIFRFQSGLAIDRPEDHLSAAHGYGVFLGLLKGQDMAGWSRRLLGLDPVSPDMAAAERVQDLEWEERAWFLEEAGTPIGAPAPTVVSDVASFFEGTRDDWPIWLRLAEGVRAAAMRLAGDDPTGRRIVLLRSARERAGLEPDGDWMESIGRSGAVMPGAAFAAMHRMAVLFGLCGTPLPCVTGAMRRLVVADLTAPVVARFLRKVAEEAEGGLAILDELEAGYARWALRLAGRRGDLGARVAFAFLHLPACDVGWLAEAVGATRRGIEKLWPMLTEGTSDDPPLVMQWGVRRPMEEAGAGAGGRGETVWIARDLATRWGPDAARGRPRRQWRPKPLDPGRLLDAVGDLSEMEPMSAVLSRFDQVMDDWKARYGHLAVRR